MIQNLYAIRDNKIGTYGAPVCALNTQDIKRQFHSLASDPATQVGKYPKDFDLVFLGEYNTETAEVYQANDAPVHIISATMILAEYQGEKNV